MPDSVQQPTQEPPSATTREERLARVKHAIARAGDLLPLPGPITAFAFLNTLQALEHLPFDEGMRVGARLYCELASGPSMAYRPRTGANARDSVHGEGVPRIAAVRLFVLTALLVMLPHWGNEAQSLLQTSILNGLGVDPANVQDQYNQLLVIKRDTGPDRSWWDILGDLSGFLESPSFPALKALALGSVPFGDEGAEMDVAVEW